MAIKELKGRTLPGRSEEPSPERPATTISTPDAAASAQEHPGDRSAFDLRRRATSKRKRVRRGEATDDSAFETARERPADLHGEVAELPAGSVDPSQTDAERESDDAAEPEETEVWSDAFGHGGADDASREEPSPAVVELWSTAREPPAEAAGESAPKPDAHRDPLFANRKKH